MNLRPWARSALRRRPDLGHNAVMDSDRIIAADATSEDDSSEAHIRRARWMNTSANRRSASN